MTYTLWVVKKPYKVPLFTSQSKKVVNKSAKHLRGKGFKIDITEEMVT